MPERRLFPIVNVAKPDDTLLRFIGREGRTLLLLLERGKHGVGATDFPGGMPFRLPAYIADLRRGGLFIETRFRPHATGRHAVYVLHTALELISTVEAG